VDANATKTADPAKPVTGAAPMEIDKNQKEVSPKELPALNTTGSKLMTISHGHHSAQGIRHNMEDEVVMYDVLQLAGTHLKITSPVSFYAVYDGHGGKKAAEYSKAFLARNLVAALEAGKDPADALTHAFIKTDADFTSGSGSDTSGTTAVTLLVEHSTKKFWCANAGDSRAVLARKNAAIPLSIDHKADRPDELERIRKAGGFVIHRRVMGELAISRAIGDKDFKAQDFKLVIADPEIKTDTIQTGDDAFIVIACDGLYDVMSNDEVVDYVQKQLQQSKDTPPNLDAIAARMVNNAIDNLHTRDNVSAIIVRLQL